MSATGPSLLIGTTSAMRRILQQIQQVAPTPAPVMIHGEAGSGKTRVAEQIHQASARSNRPFIKFRCLDTPPELLERELFGFEGEACLGDWNVGNGWLAKARGGTIYFDEITALSAATQIKLLRLLEDRVFEPPGSMTPVAADIRLLAGRACRTRAISGRLKLAIRAGRIIAVIAANICVVVARVVGHAGATTAIRIQG